MNFQDSIKTCFTKYVDFTGRASRSELWWFMLFWLLAIFIAALISHTVYSLVAIIFFLPTLAVQVRRLHDINKSGWWVLLSLIPIIGVLILIYFFVQESSMGPNSYGNFPAVG